VPTSTLNGNDGALAGLHALIRDLDLKVPPPSVRSVITGSRKTRITASEVREQYPKSYQPSKSSVGQLRFALRYEPVEIRVYKAAFHRIPKSEIEQWIRSEPNGIFARRAWYLYELLTGATLDVPDLTSGPYVNLLDPNLHIVGPVERIRRQRIFDNLLGNKDYCPLIRRTDRLQSDMGMDLAARAHALVSAVEPATSTAPPAASLAPSSPSGAA